MTSQVYSTDDGLLAASRKKSLIIRVDEVLPISPRTENPTFATLDAVTSVTNDEDDLTLSNCNSEKSIVIEQTNSKTFDMQLPLDTQSSKHPQHVTLRSHTNAVSLVSRSLSDVRKTNLQLPSFESLGIASSVPQSSERTLIDGHNDHNHSIRRKAVGRPMSRTWPPRSYAPQTLGPLVGPFGAVPPLTPPEDVDSLKWNAAIQTESISGIISMPSGTENNTTSDTRLQSAQNVNLRPSNIQLPEMRSIASEARNEPSWLQRACRLMVNNLGDSGSPQQIQMIVQCLPTQSKSDDQKPIFERVVETIQTQMSSTPYITITHAVSQVCTMEEVPASPPATPNTTHASDDYFDDSTIFTHAAVVPTYHIRAPQLSSSAPRSTNLIAAPSSIQITTLERYIPPTSSMEVKDFFKLGRRSYLADRLMELSAANGSMLLVYPTKTGAKTFASRYLGPIMEPFLRQFMMLNNLYTEVAISLSRMEALSVLPEFNEMQELLRVMCEDLGQRTTARGLPSTYQIVCAETTEVTLDRITWTEWFIEQEQARLRQNLTDYHKSGGRMPSRSSHVDVTPSTLTREVVEGLRQSREHAGNAGIEVGVFVIRRVLL